MSINPPKSEQPPSAAELNEIIDPVARLLAIMAALRDPINGCPWDIKQTFESIAPYTIEEAYEVQSAIQSGDCHELKDELGDLLLQIVFYAQIGSEDGSFNFDDIAEQICRKMIRRHPHVFADVEATTASVVKANWETIKASERSSRSGQAPNSALDGVANALPALMRAQKIGQRAARQGFDWNSLDAVLAKLDEERNELSEAFDDGENAQIEEELGDLLFTATNIARHTGLDAEVALRKATDKFERRFRLMEATLSETGKGFDEHSPDELEVAWRRAKRLEMGQEKDTEE